MALPAINIVLKATTDGFRRGVSVVDGQLDKLDRSADSVTRRMRVMGDKMSYVGNRMSLITGAAVAAGGALFAIAANAAKAGDAIGDSAKAAGMSVTAFQEYRFALKDAADMTDDEFASAVVKLNKTLGEAREGSKSAIAAFEAIGVSQAQLADQSFTTDQAMSAFVTKMEAVTDPATAAAMAAELFGKAGAKIGAGLSGVPGQVDALIDRARELGLASPAMVEAAGKFDSKMKELGLQFEATKMKIAEVLLPVIVDDLIPALQDHVIPAINSVIDTVGGWITAFGDLDPAIQTFVGAITTAFAAGGPVLVAIKTVSTVIAALFDAGPIGKLIMAAGLITAAWQAWGPDIMAAIEPAITWISDKFNWLMGVMDAFLGKIKSMAQAVTDFFSVSQQEIDAMDFSGAEGLGFGSGSGGGMGDMPGGGMGDMPGGSMDGGGGGTVRGGRNRRGGNSDAGNAIGRNLAYGIEEGLAVGLAEVTPSIAGQLQTVTDLAKQTFGVQSPSTVFAEIGGFIGQGLAQGISSTTGIVQSAVAAMGAGAVGASDAMVNDILTGLDTLFAGSQKAGAAIALVNTMIGASQEIKKGTFGFASAAKVIAQGMGFIKAIKGAKNGSTGGGRAGGGGSSGSVSVTQAPLDVRLNTIGGGDMVRWSEVGTLLDELSVRAGDRGYRIMVPK